MHSLKRIRERTAARRKAGANQTYPQHAGKASAAKPKRAALPLLAPCKHEGNVLERCHTCQGEAKHVRECDVHGTCTHRRVSDKVMNCERCQREGLGFEPGDAA
jgi:uncharacterized protein with PIN domain